MQGGSMQNEANVVSIFSRGKKENQENGLSPEVSSESLEKLSFAEVMRRNAENSERLKKEREKANRNVIRSYRLKPR